MSRNYLYSLAFLGGVILLDIAVHPLRPPADAAGWDYLEPSLAAASIVIIWLLYRRYLRELDGLRSQVQKSALERLSGICFSVALLAYVMIPLPIVLLHHR
jgi:hypothetical protein